MHACLIEAEVVTDLVPHRIAIGFAPVSALLGHLDGAAPKWTPRGTGHALAHPC
jgi:hypothetical protein